MTVEITGVIIRNGVVTITAVDVSEENLQRMERVRDDGTEKELSFLFDTHQQQVYEYLYKWLKRQKATRGSTSWGEALTSVIGTVTTISAKYRDWN